MRERRDDQTDEAENGSALFEAARRRYLLYCLYLYSNPILLSDIAYQVTIWEGNQQSDDIAEERFRTYMSLYHDHLPELADEGIVEYDQQEDVVTLGPKQGEVEERLEHHLSQEIDTLLSAEQATLGNDLPAAVPDDVYRALAQSERRQLLSYLLDEQAVTLDQATDIIVGWKVTDEGAVGANERERIRGALHHIHLPLLEEVGLVSYDRERKEIQLSSLTEPVRGVIESAVWDYQMTATGRSEQERIPSEETE